MCCKQRPPCAVGAKECCFKDEKLAAFPSSPQASRQSINNAGLLCFFFIVPACSKCVWCLFGQADPVLADIKEVCQEVEQETTQEPAEASTQVRESLFFFLVYQWGVNVIFCLHRNFIYFVSRTVPYCC